METLYSPKPRSQVWILIYRNRSIRWVQGGTVRFRLFGISLSTVKMKFLRHWKGVKCPWSILFVFYRTVVSVKCSHLKTVFTENLSLDRYGYLPLLINNNQKQRKNPTEINSINITYPLLRGYSVVIYNGNKYTMIKLQWGKNIYICYNEKYLHEFMYSH